MKHGKILLLLACIMTTVYGFTQDSGTCGGSGDNLTWFFDRSTGTLTISGEGAMWNWNGSKNKTNPPWYDFRTSITTLNIGNNVANIGGDAFYDCTSLSSVTIPASVTSIGRNAFYGCSDLKELIIEDTNSSLSLQGVGDTMYGYGYNGSFYGCPIETLYYGRNLSLTFINSTDIGGSAFGQQIKDVTISESVTRIAWGSFLRCSNLISVTIPNSVTEIGNFAFMDCTGLESIICKATTPPTLYQNTFSFPNSIKVTVPCQISSIYQKSIWGTVFTNFVEDCTSSISKVSQNEIDIYPNPVSESFNISGLTENTFITILDINGKIVLQRMIFPNGNVSAGHLPSGIYFVNVKNKTEKIIKQ